MGTDFSKELKILFKKKELQKRAIIAEFEQQVMRIDDFLHTEFKTPEWFFKEIDRIASDKKLLSSDDYKNALGKAKDLFSQLVGEFARCIAMMGRIKETLKKKLVKQIYKDINRLIVAQYKQEKHHLALRNKVDLLCFKIGFTVLEEQLKEYPSGNILDRYSKQLDLNAEERIKAEDMVSLEGLNREVDKENRGIEEKEKEEKTKTPTKKKMKKRRSK